MRRTIITALLAGSVLMLGACGDDEVGPPARGEPDPTATETAEDAATSETDTAEEPATPATGAQTPAAAGQVDPQLQASMNEYVSNLNETNEILAEVDSAVEAAAASPKLAPLIDQLKSFKTQWDEMDPAKKEQLASAFRDQLEPVVDRINQQIERIRSDPTFGDQLESLLGEIPLIEVS